MKYVGQTGRTFRTRYNEHIREIQTNGKTSKYAQHILNTTHNYDAMHKAMKILHVEKKGKMLDTLENYHIYTITKQGLQINEMSTSVYKPIHEFLIKQKQSSTLKNTSLPQNPLPTPTTTNPPFHTPPTPPPEHLPHPSFIDRQASNAKKKKLQ
jgi:hypothetical protein